MEGSSSTSHFRSVSLPSRLTNPSCTKTETKISELKSLGNLVVSGESIQSGLVGLAELYVCVEELVRSPKPQPALSRHENGTLIEDALEGSIGLLDLCSTLKDLLMLMRENMQILQSALRRKGGNSTVATHIATYLSFRRKTKTNITKCLVTLKNLEKKMGSFLLLDVNHHALMVSKVLGEVYALTLSQFNSILVFVSTKTKPTTGVQLITKLVFKSTSEHAKRKTFINDVETIDLVLKSLQKSSCNSTDTKNVDVQLTLKRLQILDASLEGFEAGLDCVFRRLIQTRASLLNIVAC